MNDPIQVLDHGFIRLVDMMGSDATIEADARVSYTGGEAEERTPEQREKLIRYLIRHGHNTPVEGVVFKFEVKAPIFVARQWIRHRMATTSEVSARYTELPEEYYVPEENQVCAQSTSSKQGRGDSLPSDAVDRFLIGLVGNSAVAFRSYRDAIGDNTARETARIGLPLSTYTRWMWKIDLHNLFHFLELRLDGHAQWEIRQYAQAIAGIVQAHCPIAWKAFEDFRLNAVTIPGPEVEALRALLRDSFSEDNVTMFECHGKILDRLRKTLGGRP